MATDFSALMPYSDLLIKLAIGLVAVIPISIIMYFGVMLAKYKYKVRIFVPINGNTSYEVVETKGGIFKSKGFRILKPKYFDDKVRLDWSIKDQKGKKYLYYVQTGDTDFTQIIPYATDKENNLLNFIAEDRATAYIVDKWAERQKQKITIQGIQPYLPVAMLGIIFVTMISSMVIIFRYAKEMLGGV